MNSNKIHIGFFRRFLSFVFDIIILVLLGNIIFLDKIFYIDSTNLVFGFSGWYTLYPLVYFLIFWIIFSSTPGKFIFNLKIVNDNGEKLSIFKAIIRIFGFFLNFLLIGIGFFWIIFNKKKKGLHDIIAKTYVIEVNPKYLNFKYFIITLIIILSFTTSSIVKYKFEKNIEKKAEQYKLSYIDFHNYPPNETKSKINKVSFNFVDAPIQKVISIFSQKTGYKFIPSKSVKGSITVRLNNVEWEKAFIIILEMNDCIYVRKNDTFYVLTLEEYQNLPMEAEAYLCKYSDIKTLVPTVQSILSDKGKVFWNENNKQIIVLGSFLNLDVIKKVLKRIDLPSFFRFSSYNELIKKSDAVLIIKPEKIFENEIEVKILKIFKGEGFNINQTMYLPKIYRPILDYARKEYKDSFFEGVKFLEKQKEWCITEDSLGIIVFLTKQNKSEKYKYFPLLYEGHYFVLYDKNIFDKVLHTSLDNLPEFLTDILKERKYI